MGKQTPITKVLVANRGEIAVRVIRAVHELGMKAVAVYSEADASAPHVQFADEALCIGAPEVSVSYLSIEALLTAAKQSGADAVHPGYGLLSESSEFAEAVQNAGLCWIGPPISSMRLMASKTEARKTMLAAGVPVVPGGELSDAAKVGFPLLVKASAGGGGKGMRRVDNPTDLQDAIDACSREAEKAFGDGTVYLERLVERPRHIEIQIFADSQGNTVHLFERECSIQRRHQKVVEESPSGAIDDALRNTMGQAAVAAAQAVNYVGAGTVEFLLNEDGNYYFLEMNTRLQVEHPVTELVTGIDLVAEQIRVAQGLPLSFRQEELVQRGHAIECRIYAEDPDTLFPQVGVIETLRIPEGPGIRHDSGIYEGWEVNVHYDPMLAKLCVWANTREAAIARMKRALADYVLLGCVSNVSLLQHVISHPEFKSGNTSTAFLDEFPYAEDATEQDIQLIACALSEATGQRAATGGTAQTRNDSNSPWTRLGD
ncbi:MAG TPA: acetyl-CoA carboxylase biotin carboxylase subunit [Myxococcales bacterium]|nr:acetyl-CoA carboxylase biotin carboxylase subunit [Myxococcales bacterium]